MKTDTPPLPLVHLNGTRKKTLLDGYDQAADKLHDFIEAWGGIEFNARDYYPNGPEAWTAARDARDEMNRHIRAVREYLDAHREHLYSFD